MYLRKVRRQKTKENKLVTVFVGILKVAEEKSRFRIKILRIRDNGSFNNIKIT
jgi:hypothetical protein